MRQRDRVTVGEEVVEIAGSIASAHRSHKR